jgi:DNA-directed RNA polymerase I, II, and III subunit RPABC2
MEEEHCSSQGSDIDDINIDDTLEASFNYSDELSGDEMNDDDYSDEDIPLSSSELNFVKLKIISNTDTYIRYNSKNKVTIPYLTKFEKTKVLGARAAQIEGGAKTLLNSNKLNNIRQSLDIAQLEFEEGLIPFIIRRYLPDGLYEDWRLSDFQNTV